MWSSPLLHHSEPALQWGVVLVAVGLAAVADVRQGRIPNRLTGALFATGLVVAIFVAGRAGGVDALLGCCLLAGPYVLLWAFAGGGAGDAKLMGGVGAWLGVAQGALCLGLVALCGAVLALALAARGGRLRAVLASVSAVARGALVPVFGGGKPGDVRSVLPPVDGAQTFPYGVAILAGTTLTAIAGLTGVTPWA